MRSSLRSYSWSVAKLAFATLILGLVAPALAAPPPVEVKPASIDFGAVAIGIQTPIRKITVTNNQAVPITLSHSEGGANAGDFIEKSMTCESGPFAMGESC